MSDESDLTGGVEGWCKGGAGVRMGSRQQDLNQVAERERERERER